MAGDSQRGGLTWTRSRSKRAVRVGTGDGGDKRSKRPGSVWEFEGGRSKSPAPVKIWAELR